jgi:hypothetical protein
MATPLHISGFKPLQPYARHSLIACPFIFDQPVLNWKTNNENQ